MAKWTGENISTVSPVHAFTAMTSNWVGLFAEIVKLRITSLVSLTTVLGYFLGTDKLAFNFIYSVVGIFLLACSSAALNQYQERKSDLLMERTKNRPIPSRRIKSINVLMISLVLLLVGLVILVLKTNTITLTVGLTTFFWYNGVYTPLKKKFSLAIIPGSLVGAFPPIAGWVAAGKDITDIKILYIALYFFIWQIPHFWLLLMVYSKDFQKGGFPVLTDRLSRKSIVSVTFLMLVVTVSISVMIPVTGILNYNLSYALLLLFSGIMIYVAYGFLNSDLSKKDIIKTFAGINIFTLFFITLLILDKFIFLM